ncbi:hypothetical protein E8E11_008567 [Didymella keratinophila]|nr:hypothetical protein E8E11_008567 [Didymella keratinophila]
MAITLTAFPSGVTFPSGFPFATSTRAVNNAFPTGDSSPDIPSEFSSLPSTVTSVFNAALNAQKSGLSTGATVGVSIGAAVAGLIIIGLIILLWKRKQKTNRSKSLNSEEKAIVPDGDSRGDVNPASDETNRIRQAEIDGGVVHEVHGAREPQKPFEADHTHTRAELDSGWRGWEAPAMVETDLSRQAVDEVDAKLAGARQQNKLRRHVP